MGSRPYCGIAATRSLLEIDPTLRWCSGGRVFFQRSENPDRELRAAAMLEQLEQEVQVVLAVAGYSPGEERREAGLLQLTTAPRDRAHI